MASELQGRDESALLCNLQACPPKGLEARSAVLCPGRLSSALHRGGDLHQERIHGGRIGHLIEGALF